MIYLIWADFSATLKQFLSQLTAPLTDPVLPALEEAAIDGNEEDLDGGSVGGNCCYSFTQ